MFIIGCNKPASNSTELPQQTTNSETNPVLGASKNENLNASAKPASDEKVCFECMGQGKVTCTAPGCRDGKVECPGPCLKLTHGRWVHMTVAGHDPSELWMKFTQSDGSWQSWNQHHVGEVVVMQNGRAVNTGPCKLCGGTTRVDCSVCKGSGAQTCKVCDGKLSVPVNWTPTDNPWLNRQPDLIRLRDGGVIMGKIVLTNISSLSVKTRDGKITHIKESDILPISEFRSVLSASK